MKRKYKVGDIVEFHLSREEGGVLAGVIKEVDPFETAPYPYSVYSLENNNFIATLAESEDVIVEGCYLKDYIIGLASDVKDLKGSIEESDILQEVQIILANRKKSHGDVKDNFNTISHFWSNYLEKDIKEKDISIMMILLKIARIKNGEARRDDWIDIIGYAKLGSEFQDEM